MLKRHACSLSQSLVTGQKIFDCRTAACCGMQVYKKINFFSKILVNEGDGQLSEFSIKTILPSVRDGQFLFNGITGLVQQFWASHLDSRGRNRQRNSALQGMCTFMYQTCLIYIVTLARCGTAQNQMSSGMSLVRLLKYHSTELNTMFFLIMQGRNWIRSGMSLLWLLKYHSTELNTMFSLSMQGRKEDFVESELHVVNRKGKTL